MNIDMELYKDNRDRVSSQLKQGEALLLFGANHHLRNGDAEYSFRQSSNFLYLSGLHEADVALVLVGGDERRFILFVTPKDKKREIWTGTMVGVEGAVVDYGADVAFPITDLKGKLVELFGGIGTLYYRFGDNHERDQMVQSAVAGARRKARKSFAVTPTRFVDPDSLIGPIRLIKSAREIALMERAAALTRDAHAKAMAMAAPGRNEFEVEAVLAHTFRMGGGVGPSYESIVATGVNACTLHYVKNDTEIAAGDLVLIDAGCEFAGYAADVTRTFPASGRFTAPQRSLYEIVLRANIEVVNFVKPGVRFSELQQLTIRILTEGLIELGLLKGDADQLIEERAFDRFYMHGVSHWLGLDVHDAGPYCEDGESIALREGMALTIEPGLYVQADDMDAPAEYRGIGIRIEDDILVTKTGARNLTAQIPKSIEEIELSIGSR